MLPSLDPQYCAANHRQTTAMEMTIEFPNPGVTVEPPSGDTSPTGTDSSALWNEFETFLTKHGQLVDQCSQADLIAALKEDKQAAIEDRQLCRNRKGCARRACDSRQDTSGHQRFVHCFLLLFWALSAE